MYMLVPHYQNSYGSKRLYGAAAIMERAANSTFGIEISPERAELWNRTATAMIHLDDELDTCPTGEYPGRYFDALAYLGSDTLGDKTTSDGYSLQPLKQALQIAEPGVTERYHKAGIGVADLVPKIRGAKSAAELGPLVLEEGRLTGDFFMVEDKGQSSRDFNEWVHEIGSFTNLLDAIIDLNRDYANGEIGFEPTAKDRQILAKLALPAYKSTLHGLPNAEYVRWPALYLRSRMKLGRLTTHG